MISVSKILSNASNFYQQINYPKISYFLKHFCSTRYPVKLQFGMISNLPMKEVTNFRVRGVVEKATLLLLNTFDNGLVEILEIQTSVVAPGPICDQGHRLVEQHLESRSRRLHPEVDVTQHVLNITVNYKQKTFLKILLYANFDRDS
jgi:hypothetical protein